MPNDNRHDKDHLGDGTGGTRDLQEALDSGAGNSGMPIEPGLEGGEGAKGNGRGRSRGRLEFGGRVK